MVIGAKNGALFAAPHDPREASAGRKRHEMEHRWGRRISCSAVVRVSAAGGMTDCGRMRDVSSSGAFVETSLAPPLFAPVEIAIVRDDEHGSEVLAWVVRRDAMGIGIEWVEADTGSICPVLGCNARCASSPRR
jgi:hypothetical protein